MSTKRLANISMLVALAIIFSYVEVLIPVNLGIPGIKLGLANLVTVIALYTLRLSDTWMISILRILIVGFMFGSGVSIVYSLAGAFLSLIVMGTMKKFNFFDIMGVSVTGAVFHNIGQITVASIVVKNISIWYYMPALLVSGVITGAIIGIASERILKVVKPIFFDT